MKIKKIPLHTQIFIALILGSVFGAVFSVDQHELKIFYLNENNKKQDRIIQDWDSLKFSSQEITKTYFSDDQLQIINKIEKKQK
jgi:hypothetical protein